jgi:phage gp46-like protein
MDTTIRIEQWADIRELALMSIGTDRGSWWADPAFGSDLWILRQAGKVDTRTAGTVQQYVQDCLKWLTDDGLAGEVACRAGRSGKNEITYTVTLSRPGRAPHIIRDVWHALS